MIDLDQIPRIALTEAVETLGLLKPNAIEDLLEVFYLCGPETPKAVALAFRKREPQVTANVKRLIGLRANGFLSERSASLLTDRGREDVVEAFHQTLLRAFFTQLRAQRLSEPLHHRDATLQYEGLFTASCAGCQRLNGRDASDYLPPHDCEVQGCALGIRQHIDFAAEAVRQWNSKIDAEVMSSIQTGHPLALTCQRCSTPVRWSSDLPPGNQMFVCEGCGRGVCSFETLREAIKSELKKLYKSET